MADSFKTHMDVDNYAYVTWVIKEEQYIGAALVLCSTWRRADPEVPRVILLSYDLAKPHILGCLRKIFTHVIEIPYIEKEFQHKWHRFADFYTWLNLCMTRIYAFKAMHQVFGNNTKFLLFDADMLVLHSMYDLFDYRTPAGTCSVLDHKDFANNPHVPKEFMGNTLLDKNLVNFSINNFWGIRAALYLLSTENGDVVFNDMLEKLKSYFPGCKLRIGPDEKFLSEYFNNDTYGWTHIPACYTNLSWQGEDSDIDNNKWVRCIHYISQKPWWVDKEKFAYWNDFDLWYCEAAEVIRELPEAERYFHMELVERHICVNVPESTMNADLADIDDLEELIANKRKWEEDNRILAYHSEVDPQTHKIIFDGEGNMIVEKRMTNLLNGIVKSLRNNNGN